MNGPIINNAPAMQRRGGIRAPELHEYPAEFQREYREANCTEPAIDIHEQNRKLKGLIASVSRPMPEAAPELPGLRQESDEEIRTAAARRAKLRAAG